MKLFLLSRNFTIPVAKKLSEILGKKTTDIKVGFSQNASDLSKSEKLYVQEEMDQLKSFGIQLNYLDLRNFYEDNSSLESTILQNDALFFTGGSVFNLSYTFEKSGMFEIYKKLLLENKIIHIGSSAGSIICTPHLKYASMYDDPNGPPETVWKTLDLFLHHISPHYINKPKYTKAFENMFKSIPDGSEDKIIPLENEMGIFVDEKQWEII